MASSSSSSHNLIMSVDSVTFYEAQKPKCPGPHRTQIISKPLAFPPTVKHTKKQYTTRYKLRVLSYLQYATRPRGPTLSREVTVAETARGFKIPACNIGGWKKQEQVLLASLGTQRRNRVAKRRWPRMEKPFYDGFMERRAVGKIVRRGWFRVTSKAFMVVHYPGEVFRFSNGWFSGNNNIFIHSLYSHYLHK